MSILSWDTFKTAYDAATPEMKQLIESEVVPNCVINAVISQHLDDAHHRPLIQLQNRYILGAVSEAQVLEEFMRLGIPAGKQVFDALQACYAKSVPAAVAPTGHTPPFTTPETPLTTPPPPPPAPNQIPPIRTMAQDMERSQQTNETVYSSTQEAILREGYSKPRADLPPPPPPPQ